ncbi:MAG TPA: MerR family DNA-binding transcriptional regulator [Actinomycetota bacterium]
MGAKKKVAKRPSGATRKVAGGLPCPECDFVAKHAMGLGRHRSARHGVVPKRAAMARPKAQAPGAPWITREQAAERADVHYNTIRHWERRGLVRTTRRAGIRGVFVHGEDVDRAAAGGTALGVGARSLSIEELERRYSELLANLERLLAATKRGAEKVTSVAAGSQRSRGGGPAKAKAKARPRRRGRPRSRR